MTSKRKKQLKTQDFQKKRLKVGKKQVPASFTDVSFKSRQINVPTQNIRSTELSNSVEPVTSRNLQFKDLLHDFNHPSVTTRVDALNGLMELLVDYGTNVFLNERIYQLMTQPIKLILDADPKVRKACLAVMEKIFMELNSSQVSPYYPLIMAFTCSAMCHINEHVRVHALKLLQILISRYPQLTVSFNAEKIIYSFIDLLVGEKIGDTKRVLVNPESKFGTVRVRLDVLENLLLFVRETFSPLRSGAFHEKRRGISPVCKARLYFSESPVQNFVGPNEASKNSWEVLNRYCNIAMDIWVECASTIIHAGRINHNGDGAKAMKIVLQILDILLDNCLKSIELCEKEVLKKLWDGISRYFLPHFPLEPTLNKSSTNEFCTDINLTMCSILASCIKLEICNLNMTERILESVQVEICKSKSIDLEMLFKCLDKMKGETDDLLVSKVFNYLKSNGGSFEEYKFVKRFLIERIGKSETAAKLSLELAESIRNWTFSLPRLICISSSKYEHSDEIIAEICDLLLICLRAPDFLRIDCDYKMKFLRLLKPIFGIEKAGKFIKGPYQNFMETTKIKFDSINDQLK